jgi:NADH-quinone oxidoreductase subunit L
LLIFETFGSVNFHQVFESVATQFPTPPEGTGVLVAITLLLFVGATGKSAQIPLFVWLPDAMAGPTPVSALIHAATMVTAGVYMIARSAALYSRAPEAMLVVAVVGVATALLAALIALTQSDIKRVLAYSTVSQLGYMFLAVGVGAFSAGIFHLYTHAFFKALLFLGSGSVILALHHEQDMLKMGGLKRYLPITWATMGIATLAIAGIPFFSGFFSKDEILWNSLVSDHGSGVLYVIGVAVAGLTAFYMARLMYLTFYGGERFSGGHGHTPEESPPVVTVPLMILAVFSAVAGFIGMPAWLWHSNYFEHFLEPSFHFSFKADHGHGAAHSHSLEIGLTILVVALAVVGIWLAHHIFIRRPGSGEQIAARFPFLYKLSRNKFYVDELYDAVVVWPTERMSRSFLWRFVDVGIIDGLVNVTGELAQGWSRQIRKMQSGYARAYANWILFGAVLVFLFYYITG